MRAGDHVGIAESVTAPLATGPLRIHHDEGEITAPVANGVDALLLYTLIWTVLFIAVFAPLATRLYLRAGKR